MQVQDVSWTRHRKKLYNVCSKAYSCFLLQKISVFLPNTGIQGQPSEESGGSRLLSLKMWNVNLEKYVADRLNRAYNLQPSKPFRIMYRIIWESVG